MSGPAQQGALIFARDSQLLANFYQRACNLPLVHQRADLTVLQMGNDGQLVISQTQIPPGVGDSSQARDCAIKLFFTVEDFQQAKQHIEELGGKVLGNLVRTPYFNVVDAVDCEGNVFHLRFFV